MIIPDSVRNSFYDNPIGGLAMYLVGPLPLRIAFRGFIAVVGTLMLAGAVNTSIVGSNGVLNRVSEDGILPHWFRHPHRRFGTSHRILNLVVGLQLADDSAQRRKYLPSGRGVCLRRDVELRDEGTGGPGAPLQAAGAARVPRSVQFQDRRRGNSDRAGPDHGDAGRAVRDQSVHEAGGDDFRRRFTLIFFAIFIASEKIDAKSARRAHAELDQFNLEPEEDLTPQKLGVRPGNVLVMVRNYNTLYNLKAVLDRVDPHQQDVVVLHLRFLQRAGSGEYELAPEQLFSLEEQKLFTRALELAEKKGKTIHLAVAAATEKWEAILRAAQSLQSSTVVLGASPNTPVVEEARLAGLAWERLPDPKPQLTLEVYFPDGQEHIFYLGPHAPRLTPKEIDLLHGIWLELSSEVAPEELHHHDVVHFALEALREDLDKGGRADILGRLRQHLIEVKNSRAPSRA